MLDLLFGKVELPPQQPLWTWITPAAWVCPRCGRVWSAQVAACIPCNEKIDKEETEP